MWKEAAQITVVCVLAVQMGLIDAIGKVIHYEFRVLSCPKCLCLWASLGWHLLHSNPLLDSAFASFVSSYAALWLSLIYDYVATKYNKAYEKVTDSAEAEPRPGSNESGEGSDAVS